MRDSPLGGLGATVFAGEAFGTAAVAFSVTTVAFFPGRAAFAAFTTFAGFAGFADGAAFLGFRVFAASPPPSGPCSPTAES
ncbi:hypothetical protein ACE1SV_27750 [Streptomyces sennicomposti]